jgi:hypothetical protein
MKTKLALCSLLAIVLAACSSVKTASNTNYDAKASGYASMAEAVPPAEGPETDIPAEGPADINTNPAYMPSPLFRTSAAGGL